MENPNQNLSDVEFDDSRTLVISETKAANNSAVTRGILESMPLKPQERYQFLRSVGFGGMKGVLLVYDKDTCREVAMAIMPDFRDRPHKDLERFVQEAQITAKLEHPNIVPVHDIGIDSTGSPFFTMKYLRGSSLQVIIRRLRSEDKATIENFPLTRLIQIYIRVVDAIGFAHSKGYCHLDLKPGNVNVGDFGEVSVLDWGLAQKLDGSEWQPGSVKGTPGFMAPELILSKGWDFPGPTADIYALGALLYTILTLNSPLNGLPADDILIHAVEDKIPPPTTVAPKFWRVPEGLEAICKKAMALYPEDRYTSVSDLKRDINRFRNGLVANAEGGSIWLYFKSFFKRHIYAIIILVLVVLTSATFLLALHYRRLIE